MTFTIRAQLTTPIPLIRCYIFTIVTYSWFVHLGAESVVGKGEFSPKMAQILKIKFWNFGKCLLRCLATFCQILEIFHFWSILAKGEQVEKFSSDRPIFKTRWNAANSTKSLLSNELSNFDFGPGNLDLLAVIQGNCSAPSHSLVLAHEVLIGWIFSSENAGQPQRRINLDCVKSSVQSDHYLILNDARNFYVEIGRFMAFLACRHA
jgi:hypothetical protein